MNVRLDTILAAILLVAFFLPWVSLGFASVSGMNIAGFPATEPKFLYLIPIAAIAVIATSLQGHNNKMLQIVAGAIPFLFLIYGAIRAGDELGGGYGDPGIFEVMGIGVYATFISAAGLLLVGLGVLKNKSKS